MVIQNTAAIISFFISITTAFKENSKIKEKYPKASYNNTRNWEKNKQTKKRNFRQTTFKTINKHLHWSFTIV